MRALKQTVPLMAALVVAGWMQSVPAEAQSLFQPAATVNDSVITEYEVDQRQRFLVLLSTPGTDREAVLDALITESLRDQEVDAVGLELSEDDIQAALNEFAGRVGLDLAEFVAVLEENGVAEETLRKFVVSGIRWREYVRARFGPRTQISEMQIDQALGTGGSENSVRVLISEIVIPAEPRNRAQVEELALQISQTTSPEEFAQFALEFSAAPTRTDGGRLPWRTLDDLPAQLRPILLALAPGEVSPPIPLPNAVAVFQLRDIEETSSGSQSFATIDYAAYYLSAETAQAAQEQATRLRGRIDSCDDLYGEAFGKPPEVLDRADTPPGEIPPEFARELDALDPGEISTRLTRNGGQTVVFLMLCSRTAAINEEVDREQAANVLRQNRINAYAESLLGQLRSDARIDIK